MHHLGRLTCRTWEVKPRNNDAAGQKIHRSGSVLRTRVPLRTNSKFPTPPRAFMGWLPGRVSQRTLPWVQDAKFQITLPTPSACMSHRSFPAKAQAPREHHPENATNLKKRELGLEHEQTEQTENGFKDSRFRPQITGHADHITV